MSEQDPDLDVIAEVEGDPRWILGPDGAPEEARRMMRRLLKIEAKIDRTEKEWDRISTLWEQHLAKLSGQRYESRSQLRQYVQVLGPLAWPDLGSVTTRSVPASARVIDGDEADAVCRELGFVKEVMDTTRLREETLRRLDETGEVLPGMEVTPADRVLVVKRLKS